MLPYFVLNTFNIGPVTLHTWGIFAGLAFVAALFIALKEAKRKKISEDRILDLAIFVLIGGVAGARIFFAAENWSYFSENTGEILNLNEGGLMFYGGAAGAAAVFLYTVFMNRRLARRGKEKIFLANMADALAPSFAIGEFIGRIGCTLGDLHLGAITALPWAQRYIDGSARHPVAVYMSLNGLLMFGALWFARVRLKTEGALFLFFVLWYSGTRFFLDFLRCGDLEICDPHYAGFTPSQYISAVVFMFSLIYLIKIFNNPPAGGTKNMEEIKKDTPENSAEKNEAKEAVSGIVFEDDHKRGDNSEHERKKTHLRMKKYWKFAIVSIVAFTVGAGLLSAYYEKFFKKDIFSFRGKTWVAYDKPIINLSIINDAECKECSTEDLIKQLKAGIMPTLSVKEIAYNSKEGKDAIARFGIKSLPALIFDSGVEKLDNFEQLSKVFENKNGQYFLNSMAVGIKPGKFLEILEPLPSDRAKGPDSAPITIIEFSDFQCPYCKVASETVKQVLAAYPDKIKFVFKNLPLAQHQNAKDAAISAECAGDQGKFWEMHDLLFANQEKLDKDSIGKYANQLKLNKADFNNCLSAAKASAKVEADSASAAEFGVSGTPAFFINGQLMFTEPTIDNFKAAIDNLLKTK